MRWRTVSLGLAALSVAFAGGSALGAERYVDAVGDTVGDAPDILAVTVSEADNGPLFSIAVEFAEERPFGTDMETYTDVMFVGLAAAPDVDERGIMDEGTYLTGTHGVTLEREAEQGAHLVTPERMYWQVVDVAVDGPVVTFTLDRQLIGNPLELHFQILVGVERGEQAEGTDEGDTYPDLGIPPASYPLGAPKW